GTLVLDIAHVNEWVDDEPWLAPATEHLLVVQVAVDHHQGRGGGQMLGQPYRGVKNLEREWAAGSLPLGRERRARCGRRVDGGAGGGGGREGAGGAAGRRGGGNG